LSNPITIEVPDIGDFKEVEIIELLVEIGDIVAIDQSLITVESDKASMEIPAPIAGEVTSIMVGVGDRISTGTAIIVVDAIEAPEIDTKPTVPAADSAPDTAPLATDTTTDISADVVVIGAGPGGYTAAFRAADLGQSVLLIERYPDLGGVCLNVGCIPSKALLHTAQIINEARDMSAHGISFGEPDIDVNKLRTFKEQVIGRLTGNAKFLLNRASPLLPHLIH